MPQSRCYDAMIEPINASLGPIEVRDQQENWTFSLALVGFECYGKRRRLPAGKGPLAAHRWLYNDKHLWY